MIEINNLWHDSRFIQGAVNFVARLEPKVDSKFFDVFDELDYELCLADLRDEKISGQEIIKKVLGRYGVPEAVRLEFNGGICDISIDINSKKLAALVSDAINRYRLAGDEANKHLVSGLSLYDRISCEADELEAQCLANPDFNRILFDIEQNSPRPNHDRAVILRQNDFHLLAAMTGGELP